jgi:predicted Zn-dependent peptidase
MFGVYSGVDPMHACETARLILNEINRLANEAIDESELDGAIEYTRGSLMLASESTDNQMVRTAQNEIHFGRHIPLKEVLDRVESVTRDEILDLAGHLFGSHQMGLTLLGPVREKKVFEEILYC